MTRIIIALLLAAAPAVALAQSSTATSGTTRPLQSAPASGDAAEPSEGRHSAGRALGREGPEGRRRRRRQSGRDQAEQVVTPGRKKRLAHARRPEPSRAAAVSPNAHLPKSLSRCSRAPQVIAADHVVEAASSGRGPRVRRDHWGRGANDTTG